MTAVTEKVERLCVCGRSSIGDLLNIYKIQERHKVTPE